MSQFRRVETAKFSIAIERFDAANELDPTRVVEDGAEVAKELLYARRMTQRLEQLFPDASEPLRLAIRAQHLCRWRSNRSDFATGRAGYNKWRVHTARMHADLAGEILVDVGYELATIERVQLLLAKRNRTIDADAQRLEDVACVVFLEHYFDNFMQHRDDDALVVILRKTWNKMSATAHAVARKLSLGPRAAALVARAVSEDLQ